MGNKPVMCRKRNCHNVCVCVCVFLVFFVYGVKMFLFLYILLLVIAFYLLSFLVKSEVRTVKHSYMVSKGGSSLSVKDSQPSLLSHERDIF